MDHAGHSLSQIGLFGDMPPHAIAQIEARCKWHHLGADALVFDKDNDTQDVYFVVGGTVRIFTSGPDDGDTSNRDVALADIAQGQYFGELAAIDGMRRSARVVATTDSVLASMPGTEFLDLMRIHPDIALKVLGRLTRVIRNLDSRVTELSVKSESQRIFGQLTKLARPDPGGDGGDDGPWLIADLPNHREIAAWTGTSKDAVAQAIGELARQGVVRRKGIGLQITDWNRLRSMAGE